MIETVTRTGATYAEVPHKFEAGTVNVGDAVGLEAAIDYIDTIGFDTIMKRERALTQLSVSYTHLLPQESVTVQILMYLMHLE